MTFPLKIVTPDGLIFDGQAEKLIVRTSTGDRAILARHIDAVFPWAWARPLWSMTASAAPPPASAVC